VRDRIISTVVGEVTDQVSLAGLVILLTVFILLGRRARGAPPGGLLGEIEAKVKLFLSRMVLLSALTGLLFGLSLWFLAVRFALVFGVLAFLLNFIPNIGSLIATALPVPVILLSPDLSVTGKVLALAIPTGIQVAIGVVQPKVLGDSLNLHAVAVLMALLFFGMIWGAVGAFLAAPLTAVIKIILEKHPATRPLAAVLEGNLEAISGVRKYQA
jgi:AI-2 transport protein TqsA